MLRTAILSPAILLILSGCSDRSRTEGRAVQSSTLDRGASARPVELAEIREEEVVEWIRAIGSIHADQLTHLSAEVAGDRGNPGGGGRPRRKGRSAGTTRRRATSHRPGPGTSRGRDGPGQPRKIETRCTATSQSLPGASDFGVLPRAGRSESADRRRTAESRPGQARRGRERPRGREHHQSGRLARSPGNTWRWVNSSKPEPASSTSRRSTASRSWFTSQGARDHPAPQGTRGGNHRGRAPRRRLPWRREHHQRPGGPPYPRLSRRDPGRQRPDREAAARVHLPRAIRGRTFENAISLPEEVVVQRDGRPVVFVATGDTASARAIETGFANRGRVLITKGLNPGDQVIVTGQQSLRSGDRIQTR